MKGLLNVSGHGLLQVGLVLIQILNLLLDVVPAKDKVYVTLAIGIMQIIVHQYGYNQAPPPATK